MYISLVFVLKELTILQANDVDSMHNVGGASGGLFEFEEPIEMDDEPIPKPTIKLNGVRVSI